MMPLSRPVLNIPHILRPLNRPSQTSPKARVPPATLLRILRHRLTCGPLPVLTMLLVVTLTTLLPILGNDPTVETSRNAICLSLLSLTGETALTLSG